MSEGTVGSTPARAAAALVALTLGLGACSSGPGAPARVTAEVAVDPIAGPDVKLAPDGGVWLPASDTFGGSAEKAPKHAAVRIDPASAEVTDVIPLDHQMSALAIGEGAVWVTGTDFGPDADLPTGSLVRIDLDRREVTGVLEFGERSSPTDVAVGFGSVWVSDSNLDRVSRVDPRSVEATAEIAVEGGPTSLAIHGDRVWVTKPGTGQIRAIDPRTDTPGRAVGTGRGPAVLESGRAGLFVADFAGDELSEIDVGAGGVTATIEFPTAPSRFAVGRDTVVVVEAEGRALSTVRDGDRDEVLDGRLLVAVALAPDGRTVWAVDAERRRVLRIALPPR